MFCTTLSWDGEEEGDAIAALRQAALALSSGHPMSGGSTSQHLPLTAMQRSPAEPPHSPHAESAPFNIQFFFYFTRAWAILPPLSNYRNFKISAGQKHNSPFHKSDIFSVSLPNPLPFCSSLRVLSKQIFQLQMASGKPRLVEVSQIWQLHFASPAFLLRGKQAAAHSFAGLLPGHSPTEGAEGPLSIPASP